MTLPGPAILIPAAGASSRMAPRDKLLEPVGGVPLLRDRALAALATGAPVAVTLPPDRPARREALADLALRIVLVPQAAEGMGRSIAAGAAALGAVAGLMILPADMPNLGPAELRILLDAFAAEPGAIHRGASGDVAGHPVVFPADLVPSLARLGGDEGARGLLRRHAGRVRLHSLPNRAALTDLDTPEAWTDWRSQTGR